MSEKLVWWFVAAIGLISCIAYSEKLLSEPLKLSPVGCGFYAQDAGQIAVIRDSGITEEQAQENYARIPYHNDVKPHLIALIHFIFSSSLTPEEAEKALYNECISNKGVIGKQM